MGDIQNNFNRIIFCLYYVFDFSLTIRPINNKFNKPLMLIHSLRCLKPCEKLRADFEKNTFETLFHTLQ